MLERPVIEYEDITQGSKQKVCEKSKNPGDAEKAETLPQKVIACKDGSSTEVELIEPGSLQQKC